MTVSRILPLLLTLTSSAWADQKILCAFRDLDTPDRIEVILKTHDSGTFAYLAGGSPQDSNTPLELKRIADTPQGLAQFDVPNPHVRMTFKIPVEQIMQNGAKFRGVLSSIIESMNLTQDQELICDSFPVIRSERSF